MTDSRQPDPSRADLNARLRLPCRVGEILNPTLTRLAKSEHVVAYYAWARACGEQVAAATSPRSFSRGLLTVECASAVWANELTYLGGTILSRMDEVVPDHPVKKLRFIIARGSGRDERSDERQEPATQRPTDALKSRPPRDLNCGWRNAENITNARLRGAVKSALEGADPTSRPPIR